MTNTNQYLAGMAYLAKLQEDLQPESPFAAFDNLTPDEPGRAQQFVMHCLKVAGHALSAHISQTLSEVSQTDAHSLSSDSQTAAILK